MSGDIKYLIILNYICQIKLSHIYCFLRNKREENEIHNYQANITKSETIARTWTPSAIDCYKIGCLCSKCNLYKIYFADYGIKCMMKQTVLELVRRYGAPKEDEGN